jgi:uncharacterized membrane protein
MKFLGHPLHIMLVHFPVALLPMDLVCYALFFYTGNVSFAEASFYAMTGGAVLGWLAIILGTFDLLKIPQENPQIMKTALIHGGINIAIITAYSVLAFMTYKQYPNLPEATMAILIVKTFLNLSMLAGNYFGGNLILKYKVGVETNNYVND